MRRHMQTTASTRELLSTMEAELPSPSPPSRYSHSHHLTHTHTIIICPYKVAVCKNTCIEVAMRPRFTHSAHTHVGKPTWKSGINLAWLDRENCGPVFSPSRPFSPPRITSFPLSLEAQQFLRWFSSLNRGMLVRACTQSSAPTLYVSYKCCNHIYTHV